MRGVVITEASSYRNEFCNDIINIPYYDQRYMHQYIINFKN